MTTPASHGGCSEQFTGAYSLHVPLILTAFPLLTQGLYQGAAVEGRLMDSAQISGSVLHRGKRTALYRDRHLRQ